MTTFQPLDVIRVSATPSMADAEPNRNVEIVKLIDVSNCTGCKACQAACLDWNEKRPEIGEHVGIFENPRDLAPDMFTIVRYAEWDNPKTGNFEWLIRKAGCMHCEDPGCLKACPAPGAIVQYANGIVNYIQENCIGCGYCVKGCPFNVPRVSKTEQVAYKCTLCSDKVAVGQQPSCVKVCPTDAIVFGPKAEMLAQAQTRIARSQGRAALRMPGFTTRKGWAARTSCTCSSTRTSRSFIRGFRQIRRSTRSCTHGREQENT